MVAYSYYSLNQVKIDLVGKGKASCYTAND